MGKNPLIETLLSECRFPLRCKLDLLSSGMLRSLDTSLVHTTSLLTTQPMLQKIPENSRTQKNYLFSSIVFVPNPTRLLSSKVKERKEVKRKK